jgi:Protein of unknown function (DUF4238)
VEHMRPEDQHYVPAGYLRSFCPDGERALHVRRRRGNEWFRKKPENIATRKNFYSVLKADGTFDDTIEHLLARGIETPGLAALWQLKEGMVIPSWYTRESIATFLAVQYVRIPDIRDNMQRLLGVLAGTFTDEILDDEGWMVEHLQETDSMPSNRAQHAVRELKSAIKAGHIRPVVRQEASMKALFKTVEDTAFGFMNMNWLVLEASEPSFFTSDIPIYVSPNATGKDLIGIISEGRVMNMPLSSRRFLLMSRLGYRGSALKKLRQVMPTAFVEAMRDLPPVVKYMQATPDILRRLNEETVICSGEWVCGSEPSDVVVEALQKPRVRTDFYMKRVAGEMTVGHRLVTEELVHDK